MVPGLVTAPAKPAAHIVQADTEMAPSCEPVVVTPGGHCVQLEAPVVEYAPSGQSAQLGNAAPGE
jgi:pimeloyl-ACP methyl ester carboxylesterase